MGSASTRFRWRWTRMSFTHFIAASSSVVADPSAREWMGQHLGRQTRPLRRATYRSHAAMAPRAARRDGLSSSVAAAMAPCARRGGRRRTRRVGTQTSRKRVTGQPALMGVSRSKLVTEGSLAARRTYSLSGHLCRRFGRPLLLDLACAAGLALLLVLAVPRLVLAAVLDVDRPPLAVRRARPRAGRRRRCAARRLGSRPLAAVGLGPAFGRHLDSAMAAAIVWVVRAVVRPLGAREVRGLPCTRVLRNLIAEEAGSEAEGQGCRRRSGLSDGDARTPRTSRGPCLSCRSRGMSQSWSASTAASRPRAPSSCTGRRGVSWLSDEGSPGGPRHAQTRLRARARGRGWTYWSPFGKKTTHHHRPGSPTRLPCQRLKTLPGQADRRKRDATKRDQLGAGGRSPRKGGGEAGRAPG